MSQKVLHCAIYRRISDEDQKKGYSLPEQEAKCKEAIFASGGVLKETHIFTDVFTGTYWRERPGLQALFIAAKRYEFDFLYMTELDRFARNLTHQEIIREELKYYGIATITLNKDEHADDDTLTGQLVRTNYGFMAEEERKKIIRRTQTGLHARVKEGSLLASRKPLYGYTWIERVVIREGEEVIVSKAAYMVNEQEAAVVRRIFSMAKQGLAFRRISYILTAEGIPTPDGKKLWRHATVKDILQNPFYIGRAAAYKRKYQFIPGEGIKKEMRPEAEHIILPAGIVPALVSEEDFYEVQRQLEYNKQVAAQNNKNSEDALLRRGLIYCGCCHAKMSVMRQGKDAWIGYFCPRRKDGYKECTNGAISSRAVDLKAWEVTYQIIQDPSLVGAVLDKKKGEDPTRDHIIAVEALLAKTDTKIINLMESIEDITNRDTRKILAYRLEVLVTEKAGYESERDLLLREKINWEEGQEALERFERWCAEQRVKLNAPSYEPSCQEKREAIERIGIEVVIYPLGHDPRFTIEVRPPENVSVFG